MVLVTLLIAETTHSFKEERLTVAHVLVVSVHGRTAWPNGLEKSCSHLCSREAEKGGV